MMRGRILLSVLAVCVFVVMLLIMLVLWVFMTSFMFNDETSTSNMYWMFMPLGTVFISMMVAASLVYLILSIRLIHLREMQSNFLDSISHELKTPIASLKLCLQTISRYNVSIQEEKSFYLRMTDDIDRLDRLINQVLRAGQLDAGRKIADAPQRFMLSGLIREITDSLINRYQLTLDHVEVNCPASMEIVSSKLPLEIIIRNLIDNAIKYSGEDPRIQVIARILNTGDIALRVSDNGPGIPARMRKKIFQRFWRLGSELERKQKGTGLGLYLVKKCVQQLGGTIDVQNNRNGKGGASFLVRIPQSELPEPGEVKS
ncbi:MAG: HAMP domain-containing sensor histidine kinase [Planctomycetia bacterium]|nr:HAMP domain-containing sensor histidine kinase [Planctomycetia bacterium]